jgi:long-chain acyl-CoA synthetase
MSSEYPSLTKCFLEAIDRFANPRAQMYRTAGGVWHPISAQEMLRRVAGLAKTLSEVGIKPGDRVALFAPNCPEWHIADFAILGLGAVTVPIYFNESPDRIAYILNDSGARIVFTCGESQARKIVGCRERIPTVEQVISGAAPAELGGDLLRYEALIASAADADIAAYRRRAAQVIPGQLATIIYTSGTTGEPKGVMLTHANLSSNTSDSANRQEVGPQDIALSFLPLAHVYERIAGYSYVFRGAAIAYVERMEDVAQALLEVHPTVAAAVPRFFEKIYATILEKGHHETGVRRRIFDWALHVADEAVPWKAYGKHAPLGLRIRWKVADSLVYSKVRQALGAGSPRFASGGAPLAKELAEFYWSIGVPVYEGYGLTETSPVVANNYPGARKVGTVGLPLPTVQVRIADDGEILVKGPNVMQGYYHKPDQTNEVLTQDGWFATGDIGKLDEDGYLIITDRKKELLKTAAGKFVAPTPIENLLKTSPFIANAMVVGDRRKFVSVLVVPNLATIEAEARKNGRELSTPFQIVNDPWVRDLITREIDRLTSRFAQFERPKRFALLEQDFTYANGQLTYTLKMKRRVIEERYQDIVDRLYANVEEPRPHHLA